GAYEKSGSVGNTMALSAVSFITGDNASKVGVSQFPGRVSKLALAPVGPKGLEAAAVGTYKVAMDIGSFGNPLYATGTINSKGALETTEKISKAADFVVAASATEGKYTIKVGDKYLEGYLNGTYKNMRLSDTAADWSWNADAKVFTCTIDSVEYYFGAYEKSGSVGNTMALSAVSFITGDNASKVGVSQFPGRISTVGFITTSDAGDKGEPEPEPEPEIQDVSKVTISREKLPTAYGDNVAVKLDGDVPFSVTKMANMNNRIQIKKDATSSIFNTGAFISDVKKVVFNFTADNAPTTVNAQTTSKGVLKLEFATKADFSDAEVIQVRIAKDGVAETVTAEATLAGAKYVRITSNNLGAVYASSIEIHTAKAAA
ncbi:MAG: hypothetical protein MJZ37_11005, partial [Bacilli bacterium]|nr:hypothetical protein [Bacilli bacterium]